MCPYLDGDIVLLTRACEVEIQVYFPLVDHHHHHVVAGLDVVLSQFSFCSHKQQSKQKKQWSATTLICNNNNDSSNNSRKNNNKSSGNKYMMEAESVLGTDTDNETARQSRHDERIHTHLARQRCHVLRRSYAATHRACRRFCCALLA